MCGPKSSLHMTLKEVAFFFSCGSVCLHPRSSQWNVFFSRMASVPVLPELYCDGGESAPERCFLPLVYNGCGPQRLTSSSDFTGSDNMKNMCLVRCEPSHVLDRREQILCF